MTEAIIGSLLGALVGGLVSWGLTSWQLRRQRSDRIKDAQLDLLRRLARHKGGSELALALNEVPVVFSGDREALRLYLDATQDGPIEMDRVIQLVMHLSTGLGLPVENAHLTRGFQA